MSQPEQSDVKKLLLCARLAAYAYSSGNPNISTNDLERKWPPGFRILNPIPLYSHSFIHKRENQHRFFKSHAYVCHLIKNDGPDNINRIVVGFRGTWLQKSTSADVSTATTSKSTQNSGVLSKALNSTFNLIGPSNYGLADLYYNATLIRVPYHRGVVWKWFAYWGTLVLEGSNRFSPIFTYPRKVAAGLVFRPHGDSIYKRENGLVHLGFWALWASPQGFAGYNRKGHLWTDQESQDSQILPESSQNSPVSDSGRVSIGPGALQSILKAVAEAKKMRQKTEILVVGHSLGGAVSCFAVLDIVAQLEQKYPGDPDITVFHATFGAPPVGTRSFATHFLKEMGRHESWAVFHERDPIASCFAKCGSLWWAGWLDWWSDWSRAGREAVIPYQEPPASASQPKNKPSLCRRVKSLINPDTFKFGVVSVGALLFLILSSLTTPLSVIVAPVCFALDCKYYSSQKNPAKDWKGSVDNEPSAGQSSSQNLDLEIMAIEYHSLEKYIKYLEDDGRLRTRPPRA